MKLFLLIICFVLTSCSSEYKIGKLKVEGLKDVFVNFTSVDQFERYDPIYFEVVNDKNEIILRKYSLSASENYETDLNKFKAKSIGSIMYITYKEEGMVYAIYDFESKKGYPNGTDGEWEYVSSVRDKLFEKLKKNNPNLKAEWNN